jgi:hypothetical protein
MPIIVEIDGIFCATLYLVDDHSAIESPLGARAAVPLTRPLKPGKNPRVRARGFWIYELADSGEPRDRKFDMISHSN